MPHSFAYPIHGALPMAAPDPLKWSLRCLETHADIERVVIAGVALPRWLNPDSVTFLEVPPAFDKREHSGLNLEAVLASDISDNFVWLNDDIFLTRDREEWPVWCSSSTLRQRVESGYPGAGRVAPNGRRYVDGLADMLELLESWGHTAPPSLDLHTPLPLEREAMAKIYARAREEKPHLERGFFRSLYVDSGCELTPLADDVKVYKHRELGDLELGVVSSSPVSWGVGELGKYIRRHYWRPSRFEL